MPEIKSPGLKFDDTMNNGDIGKRAGQTLTKVTGIPEALIVDNDAIVSFTNNKSLNEVGSTVSTATFSWVMTRDSEACASQIISGSGLVGTPVSVTPGTTRSYLASFSPSLLPSVAATYTYALATVGDDSYVDSRTSNIAFQWKMYYGVSANANLTTGALVMSNLAPQHADFATSKAKTFNFTPSGANYVYFAFPASFGAVSLSIFNSLPMTAWSYSNGSSFGHLSPTGISLTNASGGVTTYYIIRSDNVYNSPATWQIG